MAFSPDGRSIASTGRDGKVVLWDAASAKALRTLETGWAKATAAVFSPDGKALIALGSTIAGQGVRSRTNLRIWSLPSLKSLPVYRRFWASGIKFASDGETLLAYSSRHVVSWCPFRTGRRRTLFKCEKGSQLSIIALSVIAPSVITPGGDRLVLGGKSETALADFRRGECLWRITEARGKNVVAFAPDGRALALAGEGSNMKALLILLRCSDGKAIRAYSGPTDRIHAVEISRDGKFLAAGTKEGLVILWELGSGRLLWTHLAHEGWIRSIDFSPDGRLIASGGDDHSVVLTQIDRGSFHKRLGERKNSVRCLAVASNGRTLASSHEDGKTRIWDARSRRLWMALPRLQEHAIAIAYAPDGRSIVTLGGDGRARVWDAQNATLRRALDGGLIARAVGFEPSGEPLILAWTGRAKGEGGEIIWRPDTGRWTSLQGILPFDHEPCYRPPYWRYLPSYLFSPDGKTLARGLRAKIQILESATGAVRGTLEMREGENSRLRDEFTSIAFSPDGAILAAGHADSRVTLWDLGKMEKRQELRTTGDFISTIAFSPDGRFLALGSGYDSIGQVFHLPTSQVVHTIVHAAPVTAVAFSPRGDRLYSGSDDGTIRAWGIPGWRLLRVLFPPQAATV